MIYRTSPFERVQLKAIVLEEIKLTYYDSDEKRLSKIEYDLKQAKKRIFKVQLVIAIQFIVFIAVMPALLFEVGNPLGGTLASTSVLYAFYSLVLSNGSNAYEYKMMDAYKELIEEYSDKIGSQKRSVSEPSN